MTIDTSLLSNDEKAILKLRLLYERYGYKKYKMDQFEEYDFYMRNKDFLVDDGMISFTDSTGKLMALKPDVTLSIVKNSIDKEGEIQKLYYDESVFRIAKGSQSFKEIKQTGLECIGDIGNTDVCEVLTLAAKSLYEVSENYILNVSHMGMITGLLSECGFSSAIERQVLKCIGEKNVNGVEKLCDEAGVSDELKEDLACLINAYGPMRETLEGLEDIVMNDAMSEAYGELLEFTSMIEELGYGKNIQVDFSIINDLNYYNGIVFQGFVDGISVAILSGGRYDNLMNKLGKKSKAIGFAVYLDFLERMDDTNKPVKKVINVALPKGRLGEKVYAMFEEAGYPCPSIKEKNRKLIFENEELGINYFWVKPSDVSIYVERGAADVGVAGKDILLEYKPDVYELLDMNMGKCRMAVAALTDFKDDYRNTLRVATKFPNIAKKYYRGKCRDIDIIKLNGSIELAPILGLSDVIVDIVETGKTLLENNLEPIEDIVPISARFIANKASFKFKTAEIEKIVEGISKIVRESK